MVKAGYKQEVSRYERIPASFSNNNRYSGARFKDNRASTALQRRLIGGINSSSVKQLPRGSYEERFSGVKQRIDRCLINKIVFFQNATDQVIQREVRFDDGDVINNMNPTDNYLSFNFDNGFTPPVMNGNEVMDDAAAYKNISHPILSGRLNDQNSIDIFISQEPINTVSWNMYLPISGPWKREQDSSYLRSLLRGNIPESDDLNLEKKKTSEFEVKGDPDHMALSAQVKTHEEHHADDHIKAAGSILVPWDKKIAKSMEEETIYQGDTVDQAEENLYKAIGGTPLSIAKQLNREWGKKSDEFHNSVEGKTNVQDARVSEDGSKTWLIITVP